ncbi:MAG: methionyl-tRNA formyltransferase [Flavobacteriaceae bacterium]|jgi:methionyl-tRNA formyltransferase|nr:methionyl-tRNA formyltransferase [Flavobacteriaceae bacterium]MBT3754277.1 methionyl-tRNA formyltransferase [Flavobacteriaceae bacterium]MBT3794077.1 methionyl-tRNA formyltransferase [Flavobacteriaceae bacterium]MBT4063353.1 methionyl-tRNA formyltransferase [Flavobacteriaceae bacterium]MBT4246679.1 methionyl-tRNA formyltransferase [Flavobacteriaceae bacterium]
MNKLKIVFMGTTDFAVGCLDALMNSSHQIKAVITAPDREAGRGKKITHSEVKKYAINNNFKLLQPINLKDENFVNELKSINADIFVVVAFRMLPELVWRIPLKGTINLHASLLPQLRGAAPIHWAIINGLKETGVTTFFINKKIDFGDIIQQSKVKIGDIENTGELYEKLKKDGSKLLISTLKIINNDNFKSTRQTNSGKLLLAPKLNKINTRINWSDSGKDIFNFVRGLSPYPSAWSKEKRSGKILKLHSVKFEKSKTNKINHTGTIQIDKNTIKIITKDGYLEVLELQIEGKKRMSNLEFINGYKNFNSKHLL